MSSIHVNVGHSEQRASSRIRCLVHGIAAGPDGRCALCLRDERSAQRRAAARVGWTCAIGLLALTAALLLAGPVRGWLGRRNAPSPEPSRAAPAAAPEQTAREPAEPASPEQTALSTPRPQVPQEQRRSAAPASGEARIDAAPAEPPRTAEVARRPSQAEVDRALREAEIRMFSTAWCGVCRKARAFLHANNLSYIELDIDRDAPARDELRRRSGRSAVPTFEIDGQLLTPGFSERSIGNALRASVEKRLGVSGIDVRAR